MRIRSSAMITTLAVAALTFLGCATDGPVQPAVVNTPPLPATPTAVLVVLVPDSTSIALGEQIVLRAAKVMSDGTRVPVPAPFTTSQIPPHYMALSPDILTVNPITGIAVGVGAGLTRVRVEVDGLVGFGTITVTGPRSSAGSTAMTVDAFSLIEFSYGPVSAYHYYAPQLRVSAAPSRSITVLTVRLHVPGLDDPIPQWGCGAKVVAGTPRDLNGEVYGDWTFTVSGEQLATGDDATALVSFVDDTGEFGTLTIRGPVIPGALPATYTGGQSGGACFHGYGSTG